MNARPAAPKLVCTLHSFPNCTLPPETDSVGLGRGLGFEIFKDPQEMLKCRQVWGGTALCIA